MPERRTQPIGGGIPGAQRAIHESHASAHATANGAAHDAPGAAGGAPGAAHAATGATGAAPAAASGLRAWWRLINTPLHVDGRAMRTGCSIFLAVYGAIAIVRYEESHGFFWLRFVVCLYAAFGIWLARRATWRSVRGYTLVLSLLLPLVSAYIDGALGNHMHELALTGLATFSGMVFLQSGLDLAIAIVGLVAGNAFVLGMVPSPAVPLSTFIMVLGGAIATGGTAALQGLIYGARWMESLARADAAVAESAAWRHRYEAAILASGQLLYDWDPHRDEVQYAGAFERMLGYTDAELPKTLRGWVQFVHPDDWGPFEREVERVVAAKTSFHMRHRARRKDGGYVFAETNGYFVLDDAGNVVRMIGFLADITERTRVETERAEETATSSALALVGRELISSLETPVVLDRLCRLTTEVLDCDFSSTWLWKPEEHVYSGIAQHGMIDEEWDALRLLHMPSDPSSPGMTRLLYDDLTQVDRDSSTTYPMLASVIDHYGISVLLCVALRRGSEIVGIHTAGYRTRRQRFTATQERVARGIAQLASMALTNARLVEELEQAGRLKSEFVSTMSHELRTPLNVILGYTDILGDDLARDEDRAVLGRIRHSSVELLEMIEATLNVNRLAAGKDLPQIELTSLASLWDDLKTEFAALPCATEADLRWEPVGDTMLHTDRRKLKMILKNLVGNALKFTASGEIVVRCELRPDAAVLTVRDTGVGIPPEHLPHIFEMFRQVDSSDRRSYGGAGLGLYIVREFVEQLGGTIAVDSAPGRGSTFTIRLPGAPVPTTHIAA